MIRLAQSLQAWGSEGFNDVLKNEIERLDLTDLPLQQALSQSSYAIEGSFQVMVISVADNPDAIQAKTGIFYSGLIPGCSCADDPTPVSEYSEYCEIRFDIDKNTAATSVVLLPR